MGQLQTIRQELTDLGFRVVALSPDRPAKLAAAAEKRPDLDFVLLSDRKSAAARAFGVAFRVDEATRKKYEAYGIDLAEAAGESHYELPVPSVFVVVDGKIRFTYVDPDYRSRIDPKLLLAAAEASLR